MPDLKTLSERALAGDDSTRDPMHHPFAHLDVIEELAPDLAFYKAFVNLAVLDTDDGIVLIDTGAFQPMLHQQSHARVRSWTDKRVHTAVYTHGHVDHAYGLPPFLAEAKEKGHGPPNIIGHRRVPDRMRRYTETAGYNSVINSRQFGAPMKWPTEYHLPTTLYDERLDIEVGGKSVQLFHARGETDDHTWVFLPEQRALYTGDLFIWASPNAGNPQKVQRYCKEWAVALRRMASLRPAVLMPGHGLPIFGEAAVETALVDTARYLETIYEQTLALLNTGATIYDIVHSLQIPSELAERPYLLPVYDEPDFIARNIYRCLAGWYTGVPSELKPAKPSQQAQEIARLAGGVESLLTRADQLRESGDLRMACHLVDWAAEVEPESKAVHTLRAAIYEARTEAESSTMSKGIFRAAGNDSRGRLS